jgi:phenylpropionate dioxygenase-like ring-hydroxylating dioxygenase large terminal subunit
MNRTQIDNLVVDDHQRGLFQVNRQAFVDESLLQRERDAVFDKSWLYVGHASEIPNLGDYVTRKVGGRPVILVRQQDGAIQVLLNSCPHRGNRVCREKSGNARRFSCFYHAWTFSTDGALLGVPGSEAYAPAFDKGEMGLKPVPRLEVYRGLIFASYDANIVDLVSYLGNAREYVDLMLDFSGDDLEIVAGAQSYAMRANWKLLVENSIDFYHAFATHQRYFNNFLRDIGVDSSKWTSGEGRSFDKAIALDNGHSVIESLAGNLPISESAQAYLQQNRRKLEERFGAEQTHRIMDYSRNLFIFPNLVFVANWKTVRTFYPVAPDYMEIDAWALMPRGEPGDLRAQRLDNFNSFLGPAGFGTPDDVEALEACQASFATSRELAWSDISRGMKNDQPTSTDELQMRVFWRRWRDLVQGHEGPSHTGDRNAQ